MLMQWLNRSIAILLSSWVYGSTWKWIAGAFEMLPTKIFFSNLVQIQMLIYRCSHTRIQTRIYEYTRTTLTLWTTSKDLSNRQIIISVKLPYPNSYQNKNFIVHITTFLSLLCMRPHNLHGRTHILSRTKSICCAPPVPCNHFFFFFFLAHVPCNHCEGVFLYVPITASVIVLEFQLG